MKFESQIYIDLHERTSNRGFREFLRLKGYEVENVYFRFDDTGHEIMGFYKDLVRVECEVSQDI